MLSLEPQDQLVFEGASSKDLVIKNPAKKQSVAFKLKTTSPHMFFVRPNVGVLGPDKTVTVNIVMQPTGSDDLQKRHKFLVMAAIASGSDINLQEFWKEQKPSDIWDAKIKCEIIPGKVSEKASKEQPRRAVGGANVSPSNQDDESVVTANLLKQASMLEEEHSALKEEIDTLQEQGRRPKQRGRDMIKFACCVFTIIAVIVGAYYGKHYL
ncbi:vesicle-associated membrane protein-associated protein A-like [Drosophila serrata]|uniref:vesicle-associated membrane protein-associated protein A-like n=1 Tax=Drosophila serrata TaxID=7274 RepID=UPI000A1D13DE|nr:vesicle-associated membrane protein-associated protein A-like [Drosophila serrata]KAH8363842.1 hypothetical protein KR200_010539 [Drosophila serrata]